MPIKNKSLILIILISLLTGCGQPKEPGSTVAHPEDLVDDPEVIEQTVYNEVGNTSGNLSNYGFVAKQNKWIYYSIPYSYTNENNEGLYKVKEDGTVKIKLTDDSALFINVVGDWIYYACPDRKSVV